MGRVYNDRWIMTPEQLKELHECSPESVHEGKEYFDAEELKQEQEQERE